MTDRLSVVIPNYGDAETLPRAIESVAAAAPGAEVVVVDNDGIDRSSLPSRGVDLAVVHAEPQPTGHNYNAGLDAATREFVTFCDADDELVSSGVNPRVRTLETGVDVAVGDPIYVEGGDERRERLGEPDPDPVTAYLREWWVPVVGCPLCRREVFDAVRFPEWVGRAQDMALWVEVFDAFDVAYVDEPVYRYYQHGGQMSRQGLPERYACQTAVALHAAVYRSGRLRPTLRRAGRAGWNAVMSALVG